MIISMQVFMKTLWGSFKKLKTELPYDPTVTLLGIYSVERKTSPTDTCPLHVHCSTIYNSPAGSSAGKESTCNAGDPCLIHGSGRSLGEGIGYLFQCSWYILVSQMVKNLPAMRETSVRSLGWEDPLEEGMATHPSILAWRIPMDRGAWRATVHGVTKSPTRLRD